MIDSKKWSEMKDDVLIVSAETHLPFSRSLVRSKMRPNLPIKITMFLLQAFSSQLEDWSLTNWPIRSRESYNCLHRRATIHMHRRPSPSTRTMAEISSEKNCNAFTAQLMWWECLNCCSGIFIPSHFRVGIINSSSEFSLWHAAPILHYRPATTIKAGSVWTNRKPGHGAADQSEAGPWAPLVSGAGARSHKCWPDKLTCDPRVKRELPS